MIKLVYLICCVTSLAACTLERMTPEQVVELKIDSLIHKMTLPEKIELIGGGSGVYNMKSIDRLGIPEIWMPAGPDIVRDYGRLTSFPSYVNMASTWDTLLSGKVGRRTAIELKSKRVHVWLYPGVNIYRAPMCGRNFEYMGEDPYLAGQVSSAYIRGVQSEGVMATIKHFAGNNQEFNRFNVSSDIDERTLHEIYLPAFKAAVEQGNVACVMTSYNPLNGIRTSHSDYLINQVLKETWGFKGFVMSDWGAVTNGIAAANAGLDVEMPSGRHMVTDTLIPAVRSGIVKEEVIDDKIRRILRMYYRFNFMDTSKYYTIHDIDYQPGVDLALEAAQGGIILLKNNNNCLPLDPRIIKSIAVLGPNSIEAVTGGGGSSYIIPFKAVSVLQGIKEIAGNWIEVLSEAGPFGKFPEEFYNNTTFEEEGLKGEFFNNVKLEGTPVTVVYSKRLDNVFRAGEMPEGVQSHNFSARWTGRYLARSTGNYIIAVNGSDGYRLTFGDQRLFDFWQIQADSIRFVKIKLQAGKSYRFSLDFFEGGDWADAGVIRVGIGQEIPGRLEKAVSLARKADVAVVCAGFDPSTEMEGCDRPYGLPPEQVNFIRSVASANKNTIVVLNAGGNTAIAEWIEDVPALLHAGYPGEQGGRAIAEILFGKVNPSGKLPYTIEKEWKDAAVYRAYYDDDSDLHVKYEEGIFSGYRHFDKNNIDPLFPFGFGLSYTTFGYSNMKLKKQFNTRDTLVVNLDIKNTGAVTGKEIVQLYVSDKECSLPRPIKELKAFSAVTLSPGETKTVTMKLDKSAFSFYDPGKHDWIAVPGVFEILAGSSSGDIRLYATTTLTGND